MRTFLLVLTEMVGITHCMPCDGSVLSRSSGDSLLIDQRECNISLDHDVYEIDLNTSLRCDSKDQQTSQFLEPNGSETEVRSRKAPISNLKSLTGEISIPSTSLEVEESEKITNGFNGHNFAHCNHSYANGDANLISSTRSIQKAIKSTSQVLNNNLK